MITWSGFTRYMVETRGNVARSVWEAARREGIARYRDRPMVATEPLDFTDIVTRVETALAA